MPTNDEQSPAPAQGTDVGKFALRAYREMLTYLFLSTSSIVGLLIVLIFFPGIIYPLFHMNAPPISIFLLVVMTGTLGAFFSALLRLYELKNLPTVLYENGLQLRGSSLFIYTLTPALIGGIAAAILYLIFQAGVLQGGALFPTFGCAASEKSCSRLGALLDGYGPAGAADFAKAILWSFIAGFAERLVPDLLENFAQSDALKNAASKAAQAATDKQAKSAATSPVAGADENHSPDLSPAGPMTPQIASRGAANTT